MNEIENPLRLYRGELTLLGYARLPSRGWRVHDLQMGTSENWQPLGDFAVYHNTASERPCYHDGYGLKEVDLDQLPRFIQYKWRKLTK